jgi:hypothetical protein
MCLHLLLDQPLSYHSMAVHAEFAEHKSLHACTLASPVATFVCDKSTNVEETQ